MSCNCLPVPCCVHKILYTTTGLQTAVLYISLSVNAAGKTVPLYAKRRVCAMQCTDHLVNYPQCAGDRLLGSARLHVSVMSTRSPHFMTEHIVHHTYCGGGYAVGKYILLRILYDRGTTLHRENIHRRPLSCKSRLRL